jgi:TetR/AcrR family transcriptional regulator, transcriptional repressor for nem operon
LSARTKSRDLAKQETREALIQAGMAAFSEEGVDLPSLDAICARAGFTRGAFYVHFKDREDFFAAVVDKVLEDFVHWVLSAAGSEGGIQRVVDLFIDVVRDGKLPVNDRHRLLMQIVARGAKPGAPTYKPYKALIEEAIARLSQAAQREHDKLKRDLDPDLLGVVLVASAVGFIALVEAGYAPEYEKVRAFMHGLLLRKHSDTGE